MEREGKKRRARGFIKRRPSPGGEEWVKKGRVVKLKMHGDAA